MGALLEQRHCPEPQGHSHMVAHGAQESLKACVMFQLMFLGRGSGRQDCYFGSQVGDGVCWPPVRTPHNTAGLWVLAGSGLTTCCSSLAA